jgi:large-conductance mechanosensitive channel
MDSTSSMSITDDFSQFVKDNNIVGLALGIIMAQSSIELAKNLTEDIVKPIVKYAINKDQDLVLSPEDIIGDLIMLLLTVVIIYMVARSFGVKTSTKNLSVYMNAN